MPRKCDLYLQKNMGTEFKFDGMGIPLSIFREIVEIVSQLWLAYGNTITNVRYKILEGHWWEIQSLGGGESNAGSRLEPLPLQMRFYVHWIAN